MIALSVNDISLEFGTDVILDNINFSINEGDRLGIVGVNGAGKSTLLKIICGNMEASRGNVYVGKGKTVAMLEQNAMLFSESSVFEEMLHSFPEQLRLSVHHTDSALMTGVCTQTAANTFFFVNPDDFTDHIPSSNLRYLEKLYSL